ncbi:hypothetical protein Taro_032677 [Colocasia esculenta]|uniref:CCHC-type domain-containing protein n=1 Tax=Colocasia esculenta TaxID=4460 RepID=A0A843W6T4_COLES|nr:hypothetical protein [Colocasia esculenta]
MASRGRRGGASAHEDEPRRDDQAEQQVPALRGPVLPPPPPVDYGVFMQGLVQAMQTQAHTHTALQAQLEAQAQAPAQDHGGPSIMGQFKRMTPPSFKGESDPLMAESWLRETEKIFRAIRCPNEDKVTLATYMLQVPSVRSPGVKKECPHCGKTHGGSECWLVAGRCLKCGSSDHKIKDCPRLQQGAQRGAPAPAVAAAALAKGRPGRPRPARVFALAREDAEQAEHVTEGVVGDVAPLEESVETDSERGD